MTDIAERLAKVRQHMSSLGLDALIVPRADEYLGEEIDGMREAHIRDGVAVVRFLRWLDEEVASGRLHTEAEQSDRLYDFRTRGDHFSGSRQRGDVPLQPSQHGRHPHHRHRPAHG